MHDIITPGERVFRCFSYCILAVLSLVCIAPFILIILASITSESALVANGYSFFPKELSLDAFRYLGSRYTTILKTYGISLTVTVVGTVLSVILTTMLAYPLSRQDFPFRNALSFFVLFTMLFNGGVVSSYFMWSRVFHINNTIFALILPNFLVTAMNVFLVRNYFSHNIPREVIEAAQIDGASEFRIFFKIMMPMAVPVIATIALFTGLIYWNDWTNSIYYITDPNLYSIQNYLMVLIQDIQYLQSGSAGTNMATGAILQMPSTAIRMALAVIGVIPVLVAFPFFQKYLVKGVVAGSVKG